MSFAFATYESGARNLWLDEAYSVYTVQRDWNTFWTIVLNVEANQALYHIILKFWILLGDDEATLRFLSAIFSTASVPVIYLLGKELFDKNTGVVAAFLIGVNGNFIFYAQEVRGYSLLLFLTLCSSYLAVRCVKSPSRKMWTWYVVVNILATYVHFFAVWIIIVHAALLFFLPRKDLNWKSILTSACFIIIFLCPLLLFILFRDEGQINWLWRPNFNSLINLHYSLTGLHHTFSGNSRSAVVMFSSFTYFFLCSIPIVYFIHSWIKNGFSKITWRYAFIVCLLYLPIALVYWVSMLKPIFHLRYLLIVLPGFILAASFTLTRFDKRWMSIMASTTMIICGAWITVDSYEDIKKPNWRGVAEHIHSSSLNNDALFFIQEGGVLPFQYYWNKIKKPKKKVIFGNPNWPYANLFGTMQRKIDLEWIKKLSQRHERIWFVMLTWVGKHQLSQSRAWLETYYLKKQFWDYKQRLQLELYLNKNSLPFSQTLKSDAEQPKEQANN